MLLIILSALVVTTVATSISTYVMYQQVRALRQQLIGAHTNSSFDCLTRTGIRAIWKSAKKGIIFMDIDFMHAMNSLVGYAVVDAMIKRALATLRDTDQVEQIGQWMSGDEFVVTCKAGDEIGLATRLKAVMAEITQEMLTSPEIMAKHEELVASDPRYGMSVPTFSATYGCVVSGPKDDLAVTVARAAAKVQAAKANGDRGTVNS